MQHFVHISALDAVAIGFAQIAFLFTQLSYEISYFFQLSTTYACIYLYPNVYIPFEDSLAGNEDIVLLFWLANSWQDQRKI